MNKTGSGSALPRAMLLLLLQTREQLLGHLNTKNSIESLFSPLQDRLGSGHYCLSQILS